VGQNICNKMRCYWEHVEEQIGNLGYMLGSLMAIEWALGTWREHIGNFSLVKCTNFITNCVHHLFWLRIMVGA
jgi:hypothetical protein